MLWRYGTLGRTQNLPVRYMMFSYDVIADLLCLISMKLPPSFGVAKPLLWPSRTLFLRAAPEKFENDLLHSKKASIAFLPQHAG